MTSYRYIGFATDKESKLKTIAKNELWFSSPDQFNDPFDCNFPILTEISESQYNVFIDSLHNDRDSKEEIKKVNFKSIPVAQRQRYLEPITEIFRSKIRSWGVCCFSQKWDSILMWSHYADKHSGICIGYEIEEKNEILHEVEYKKEYPSIAIHKTISPKGLSEELSKYLLTKAEEWKYEQEWRIIDFTISNQADPSPFPIKEIVFGLYTPEDLKQKIMSSFSKDVSFYETVHETSGIYELTRSLYDSI